MVSGAGWFFSQVQRSRYEDLNPILNFERQFISILHLPLPSWDQIVLCPFPLRNCISSIKYLYLYGICRYKEKQDVQNYKSNICKLPRSSSKSVHIEVSSSPENLWDSEVPFGKNQSLYSIVEYLFDFRLLFAEL